MMKINTFRQKMYVVLSLIILASSTIAVAAGGVTVWHSKGDSIVEGYLQVTGTISGSNLTSTESLPYTNITGTPSGVQPYSYLIGVFPNSTYYAVNGTDNQYVVSWTSTDAGTVLNSTIYGLPKTSDNVYYGNIHFTAGNFTTDEIIYLPAASSITITGEGSGVTTYTYDDNNVLEQYFWGHTYYHVGVFTYNSSVSIVDYVNNFTGATVKSTMQFFSISKMTIDTSAEPSIDGFYFNHVEQTEMNDITIKGQFSITGASYSQYQNAGIYYDTGCTANVRNDLSGVIVEGYQMGMVVNGDHFELDTCQFLSNYIGIQFNGAYHWQANNIMCYLSLYHALVFNFSTPYGATTGAPITFINPSFEGVFWGNGSYVQVDAITNGTMLINPVFIKGALTTVPFITGIQPNSTTNNIYMWWSGNTIPISAVTSGLEATGFTTPPASLTINANGTCNVNGTAEIATAWTVARYYLPLSSTAQHYSVNWQVYLTTNSSTMHIFIKYIDANDATVTREEFSSLSSPASKGGSLSFIGKAFQIDVCGETNNQLITYTLQTLHVTHNT